MKLCLISDSHGMLPKIPRDVDIVICAGDICPDRWHRNGSQQEWLDEVFSAWAKGVNLPIYATWGNHDFVGERNPNTFGDNLPPNISIFKDELVDIEGIPVWFSPWSPTFGNWAFMKGEDDLKKIYSNIPLETQIIVSHSPPKGLCDRTLSGDLAGSSALLEAMDRLENLEMVVCGHIHEGRGSTITDSGVSVLNASLVDFHYVARHSPVIVEIE